MKSWGFDVWYLKVNKKLNSDIDCKYRGVVVRLRGFSLIFSWSWFTFFTDLGLTFYQRSRGHFQNKREGTFSKRSDFLNFLNDDFSKDQHHFSMIAILRFKVIFYDQKGFLIATFILSISLLSSILHGRIFLGRPLLSSR